MRFHLRHANTKKASHFFKWNAFNKIPLITPFDIETDNMCRTPISYQKK